MHTFYRDRLTRCYLGASNKKRNPSPITGFDERDSNDLPVDKMTPAQVSRSDAYFLLRDEYHLR